MEHPLRVVIADDHPLVRRALAESLTRALGNADIIEVGSLARSLSPEMVLSADLSGMDLIKAVQQAPTSEYLLIEPSGQVFGVLAAADLDLAFAGV